MDFANRISSYLCIRDSAPKWIRRILLTLLFIIIAVAAFKGARLPNLWSTLYFQISAFDGIYRRFFLGTLLYPLDCERFSHFTTVAFQALTFATAISTLILQTIRSGMLVFTAIFFLSSAGGFIFNAIGYPEFIMYVAAAAGIWMISKGKRIAPSLIAGALVMTHEMAVFTALPFMLAGALIADRGINVRNIAIIFLPSAAFFLLQVKFFQTYPQSTIDTYLAAREQCGYPQIRLDHLDVLRITYKERIMIFYSATQLKFMIPPLVALAIAVGAAVATQFSRLRIFYGALIALACMAPLTLGLAGWDNNRWMTMSFANALLVLICAARIAKQQWTPNLLPTAAAFVLVAATLQVSYFDVGPRNLDKSGIESWQKYISHDAEKIPTR